MSSTKTFIDLICSINQYYDLVDRASHLTSLSHHGWVPSSESPGWATNPRGLAWFAFSDKGEATMFKLMAI